MDQMKKVIPAIGATIAFSVNKCRLDGWLQLLARVVARRTFITSYILWMGNQMAGRDINQNKKKHMKSLVVVPEDSGR